MMEPPLGIPRLLDLTKGEVGPQAALVIPVWQELLPSSVFKRRKIELG